MGYRPLKLELLKEKPYCYWCGIKVIDYIPKDGERTPDNTATIDHLISRFWRNKGKVVKKVLCCNKCNNLRARLEEKGIFKF